MLSIDNLSCRDRPRVSFRLDEGEFVCLSGPSGSGKTQLLRAIVDLDPNQGSVKLRDSARESLPPPQWRRRVGFLPADSRWWAATVGEHFVSLDAAQLERLGFGREVGEWRVERLSSGEKQRLALLRLLANRPEVLLLDEPTANLDPDNGRRVAQLVRDYVESSRASCLWVSHDRGQVESLCDRCLTLLADGRLEART